METETPYVVNFILPARPDLPGIDDPKIVESCRRGEREAPKYSTLDIRKLEYEFGKIREYFSHKSF